MSAVQGSKSSPADYAANIGGGVGGVGRGGGGNSTNASTSMIGGKAVFENDNYDIEMGDNDEVIIHNKNTGETYKAWGDPHMDVDGKRAFDFKGDKTLILDDGTKVTIQTSPGPNGTTYPSKVSITNGDYGVQVRGIESSKPGDLKIDESLGGAALDSWVEDGVTMKENANGRGFVGAQGEAIDQKWIDVMEKFQENLLRQGADDEDRDARGGWLQAIAKSMGQVLGAKAAHMVQLSADISGLNEQTTEGQGGGADAGNSVRTQLDKKLAMEMNLKMTEFQATSQEYSILSNTFSTAIKGLGEAMSSMAKK